MSRWSRCGDRAKTYWTSIWGNTLSAECCTTVTMFFVAVILLFDAILLIPYSVFNALRERK